MRFLQIFFASLSLTLALALISFPVSQDAQIVLGIVMLTLMMAIDRLRLQGPWRAIFIVFGLTLIVRYMIWRGTSTLPPVDDTVNFIASLVVFAAEIFCFLAMLLGLFAVVRLKDRPKAPAIDPETAPTVDVFVPSYNESIEIVAATLAAAKRMRYPAGKLKLHLLDDGATLERLNSPNPEIAEAAKTRGAQFRALCEEVGVTYHARERNVSAKAGNLNAGLATTDGDLVVVFDADHAPSREFLEETVGHFLEDPRLFLVQTPHFFLNPDPIERNLATFATMPSESEMFYSVIQKGLDNWNASFFCGSAAVLRREALQEVGGFSGVSITEDCETSVDLHSRGWNSVYVDKPMIAGLQPETFASFIEQRSRWCRGMIQILLLKNPMFRSGLNLAQRICYLSSSMFWLFPIPRMIFLIAPLLFIFFDMEIYKATVSEFFAYTVIYMGALLIMQSYLYGRVRWPLISELYEYVQSVYLIGAVLKVLMNPRAPKFKVTNKGVAVDRDYLSELAAPYYAIFTILLTAAVITVERYISEPEVRGLVLIVGLWNFLNLIIAGLALGVVSERRERRRMPRVASHRLAGTIEIESEVLDVTISDISSGGAKVHIAGGRLIPGFSADRGAIVRTSLEDGEALSIPVQVMGAGRDEGGRFFGLKFTDDCNDRYRLIAEMQFSDLAKIEDTRAKRRRRRSQLVWLPRVAAWAGSQAVRGFSYAAFRRQSGLFGRDKG
jgi:cellulose synthase (UDP-forming)